MPKRRTEPGVRKGKRSLLASHTRCKCSLETTHNLAKVKPGIKVNKVFQMLESDVPKVPKHAEGKWEGVINKKKKIKFT